MGLTIPQSKQLVWGFLICWRQILYKCVKVLTYKTVS